MADAIILIVVVVLVLIALRSSIRHFKGEGGCCGGEKVPKQSKKLTGVSCRKRILIEGMHCENCRNSVERSINRLEGASAEADLVKKQAIVSMEREIEDEKLKKAVEDAGYQVIGIERC